MDYILTTEAATVRVEAENAAGKESAKDRRVERLMDILNESRGQKNE